MFVLGIDPGLTTTGYGVLSSTSHEVSAVAAGVIRTDREASVSQRLLELHEDLLAVVDEHRPTVAAIEQVFVNRNLHTATAVARASGVAMVALAARNLPVSEYTPTAVKMALTGYGDASKEQVQRMVAIRLDLPELPQPADAADALAVALCHLQSTTAIQPQEMAR